jgi:hypothetical protein
MRHKNRKYQELRHQMNILAELKAQHLIESQHQTIKSTINQSTKFSITS